MASRKPTASRPRIPRSNAVEGQDVSAGSIAPLIPERLAYKYNRAMMEKHYNTLLAISKAHHGSHSDVTAKRYLTANLVELICSLYGMKLSETEHGKCDEAVKQCLPVREHNAAFLTHSMFVTMVGMVVARALEQANAALEPEKTWDDLLLDRYYVRNIATHDSSKTSAMETAAYSGIMAYFIEKDHATQRGQVESPHHKGIAADDILTPMANHGLRHHYMNNSHHPEHNNRGLMTNLDVIEAVVDGLACRLERNNDFRTAEDWIDGYFVSRFPHGNNRDFAQCVLNVLKRYVTDADFKALIEFRRSVHAITGTYVPWGHPVKISLPVPRVEDMTAKKKRSPRAKCED